MKRSIINLSVLSLVLASPLAMANWSVMNSSNGHKYAYSKIEVMGGVDYYMSDMGTLFLGRTSGEKSCNPEEETEKQTMHYRVNGQAIIAVGGCTKTGNLFIAPKNEAGADFVKAELRTKHALTIELEFVDKPLTINANGYTKAVNEISEYYKNAL